MITALAPAGRWQQVVPGDEPMDADDARVGFSIAPTPAGAWLWRTVDRRGELRAQGLAATRKEAAALVIRDILQARLALTHPRPAPLRRQISRTLVDSRPRAPGGAPVHRCPQGKEPAAGGAARRVVAP